MDPVFVAKAISVGTAFALSGYYTCSSQNALQILIGQPASISTPAFTQLYHRGASAVGPASAIATVAYAYLAYATPDASKRRAYGVSAVLTIGVLPWTVFVMMGGINRLIAIGKDPALQLTAQSSGEVGKLLRTWGAQNYVRAGMTVAAGLIGLSTVV